MEQILKYLRILDWFVNILSLQNCKQKYTEDIVNCFLKAVALSINVGVHPLNQRLLISWVLVASFLNISRSDKENAYT